MANFCVKFFLSETTLCKNFPLRVYTTCRMTRRNLYKQQEGCSPFHFIFGAEFDGDVLVPIDVEFHNRMAIHGVRNLYVLVYEDPGDILCEKSYQGYN